MMKLKYIIFSLSALVTGHLAKSQSVANKPTATTGPVGSISPIVSPSAYPAGLKVNSVKTRQAYANTALINTYELFNAETDITKVKETTTYVDGLGRPIQSIARQASAGASPTDIVTAVLYDEFGRETYKFMPYVSSQTSGLFRMNPFNEQRTFNQAKYPGEEFYYAKTVFEHAPSSRPLKELAPGKSWAGSEVASGNADAEHAVRLSYLANTADDKVHIWDISYQAITGNRSSDNQINIPNSGVNSVYPAGELTVGISRDEHNKEVVEYKDKEGRVLLKKVQIGTGTGANAVYDNFLCTYYVYDDFSRLRFVIPPKVVDAIKSTWQLTEEMANELCFRYEYDAQGRMIAKKVPGAGWVYMIYDKRDRLVFTQDANMAAKNWWSTTLYDPMDRPVWTGITRYSSGYSALVGHVNSVSTTGPVSSHTSIASDVTDNYVNQRESGITVYTGSNSVNFVGEFESMAGDEFITESESSFIPIFLVDVNGSPIPSGAKTLGLTITTYGDNNASENQFIYSSTDNSKLDILSGSGQNPEALPGQASKHTRGMPVVQRKRVLKFNSDIEEMELAEWISEAFFYDDKGRLVQSQTENIKNNSNNRDIQTTRYNFSGQPLVTYLNHNNQASGNSRSRVKTQLKYDHAGRLLEVWKTLNDNNVAILVAKNEYDELGQLKQKSLGRKKNAANEYLSEPLETLDYDYNIRGWLKAVNKDYANKNGANANNRWFGMELNYDWGFEANQFNGNIAGTKWRSKGDGEQRAFGYGYDAANRILFADFNQLKGSAWGKVAASGSGYTVNIDFSVLMGNGIDPAQAYDANGNILRMKQYGLKLNSSPLIDDLEYTYYANSNKLKSVKDHQNDPTTSLGDFRSSALYMSSLGGTKTTAATDYTYDANGNLKKDLNKDIGDATTEGIEYNHLNLPFKITVKNANGTKGTITYIYDAGGNKLEKRVQDNTNAEAPYKNTTYIGPFVYESDKLQFISHEEGRIRPKETIVGGQPTTAFIYDYFIKDHLGNVRMVLTEEVQKDIYPIASLENTEAVNLEKAYYNIDGVNIVDKSAAMQIPDYANNNGIPSNNSQVTETNMSQRLYRLNGNVQGSKMGLGITLKVMAGDQVDIMAKSYWKTADGNVTGTPSAIDLEGLLTNFVGNGIANKQGITGPLLNSAGGITSMLNELLNGQSQTSTRPKAYLNWILFDENFRPVTGSGHTNSGFDAVGANGELKPHSKSTGEITKNGYLYIYCSNESRLDVFFDNLQVVHTRGALLEETHYYPFGLTMGGISSKAAGSVDNKKKYNGIDFENDLDLNTYDAFFRELDPQTGRWWQIDPKIEMQMEAWSPYVSNFDNPVRYSDRLGDLPCETCKEFFGDVKDAVVKTGKAWGSAFMRGAEWVNDNLNPLTSVAELATGKSYMSGFTEGKSRQTSAVELGMSVLSPGGKLEMGLVKAEVAALTKKSAKAATLEANRLAGKEGENIATNLLKANAKDGTTVYSQVAAKFEDGTRTILDNVILDNKTGKVLLMNETKTGAKATLSKQQARIAAGESVTLVSRKVLDIAKGQVFSSLTTPYQRTFVDLVSGRVTIK